jgi:hypothetical protein
MRIAESVRNGQEVLFISFITNHKQLTKMRKLTTLFLAINFLAIASCQKANTDALQTSPVPEQEPAVKLKAGFPADEDWGISKPFNLNSVNADVSGVIAVKNISGVPLPKQYLYKYAAAGTYKAAFVIRNGNIKGTDEKVISFDITITP